MHFYQASNTPLASENWEHKLNRQKPDSSLEKILSGRLPKGIKHGEIKDFFLATIKKSDPATINVNLDFNHFTTFAKKKTREQKIFFPLEPALRIPKKPLS